MKKFLIVVDMQKDFVDGALGTKEAVQIVPAVVSEIEKAKNEGSVIIATMDTHTPDYLGSAEGKKLPVVHCVKGSAGWQLDKRVEQALGGALRLEKPSFGSVKLPRIIKSLLDEGEEASFELIGLCTDICVVSNALMLKAHFPEAAFSVKAACCAGVTPEKHKAALDTMASCQIDII